jgi:uncharacterized protein YjgD (DUF1641 family)
MAKPIKQIEKKQATPEEIQTQAVNDLLVTLTESRESLTKTLEIVQELQNAGILDMIKGFLKTREKLSVLAVEQLNQPSMHRIIKNGFGAVEFIGELDPDKLKTIMNAVNAGLEKSDKELKSQEQIGMWGMVKALRDPHINASLVMLLNFLQGMGSELDKKPLH